MTLNPLRPLGVHTNTHSLTKCVSECGWFTEPSLIHVKDPASLYQGAGPLVTWSLAATSRRMRGRASFKLTKAQTPGTFRVQAFRVK